MTKDLINFNDELVLISGGLGILGQRFAESYLECGARVAIVDRLTDTPEQVTAKFTDTDYDGKIIGYAADLGNRDDVERVFAEIISKQGVVNHLINNAASKSSDVAEFMKGPSDFNLDTWDEVMRVNVDAAFQLAQLTGNALIKAKQPGSILFIASIYGVVAPNPSLYEGSFYLGSQINTPPIYSASKAGLVGLTRYLAAYWGEHGIRVNCMSPGGVDSGQNDAFRDRYASRVPMKRMGETSDMVWPAIFLTSSLAAYINGHNLVVDGGMSIW